jgi:hypothetical protein
MQEVPWDKLKFGKEYYIERILPTIINEYGTPKGQKKEGIFVKIEYFNGEPHTRFRNLINPPRNTEGPDLPSALGTVDKNTFPIEGYRFYNVLPQDLKEKVKNSDIEENRLRQQLADEVVGNIPGLTEEVKKYIGGKKSRKTKKSKKTKKGKKSKKSRKNKKRH